MNPDRNPNQESVAAPINTPPAGQTVSGGVNNLSFNHRSIRVKKARLSRRLVKRQLLVVRLTFVFLAGGGLYLLISGQQLGYLVLVGAVALAMLLLWNDWHLQQLPSSMSPELASSGRLDELLASDVIARFSWPASPQQLWQAVDGNWQVIFFTVRLGIDPTFFGSNAGRDAAQSGPTLSQAIQMSLELEQPNVSAGALAAALIVNTPGVDEYLAQLKLGTEDVVSALRWLTRIQRIIDRTKQKQYYGGLARDWTAGFTPLLNQVGQNLSREVQAGAAYHGDTNIREGLIVEMIAALAQPSRNSVALVGDTGVGKSLTVYSLAEKLLKGESPALRYHQVFMLNASALLANAQQPGQLEQLLLAVLNEAARSKNVILFLDEAEVFFSEGVGALDISKLLLPVLQSNAVRIIMAMTPSDWQKLTASNNALASLLTYQAIKEPTEAETINILQDQTLLIESKVSAAGNKVRVMYQAITEAYKLAGRYIQDLAYPGRAIRLLETAVNHAENGIVTAHSVEVAIETTQGVKVSQAGGEEREKLLNLEEELHKRMINQSRAVKVVSDALRRARAGVSNQNRPLGTFLFLGPTGVGKTELSKSLAAVYFGGPERMVRVDMTEYSQASSVQRLLDAGTGNTTSTFLAAMRQNPFAVVLFDEIEKAHPEVQNLFLQLLDEGRLTDSNGRVVSFKDAIIISTSNAGADRIRERIEAGQQLQQFEKEFEDELVNSGQFRPEFLNRFDEIVLFRPLTPEELKQVVYLLIAEVNATLEPQKVQVALSDPAVEWLVEKGYDPRLGARPMRRMVQRSVENVVAKRLLEGATQPGQQILLDVAELEGSQLQTT